MNALAVAASQLLDACALLYREFCLQAGAGLCGRASPGAQHCPPLPPALPRSFFDFDKLAEVTTVVTRNLNKIIDVNYYPVETARRSNMRHRPIGLGVQVGAAVLASSCRPQPANEVATGRVGVS